MKRQAGNPFVDQPAIPETLQRAISSVEPDGFAYCDPKLRAVLLAADFTDQQYAWLGGTTTWQAGDLAPAAAARNSGAILQQAQAGSLSGKIVRVRGMWIGTPAAGIETQISWGLFAQGLAPATANNVDRLGVARDSRHAGQTSLCQIRFCTTIAGFTAAGAIILPAGTIAQPVYIPLAESFTDNTAGFFVTSSTVNQRFMCSIAWDERQATKVELSR